jgi:hypothetical protein
MCSLVEFEYQSNLSLRNALKHKFLRLSQFYDLMQQCIYCVPSMSSFPMEKQYRFLLIKNHNEIFGILEFFAQLNNTSLIFDIIIRY